MNYAIYNGKLIPKSQAKIPISDKGYFFDFAVYSSIKVIQNEIFFPTYHIKRLLRSAKIIGLTHPFTEKDMINWIEKLVKKLELPDVLLKIILIGDPDGNNEEKLFIFPVTGLTYHPAHLYRKGAKVITYPGERRFPEAKTKDLLLSFLAYREAKKSGAIDALLIDNNGFIREGTQSNFFAIKDNFVISPPQDKILEGITKKFILKAIKNEFKIKYENIALSNLSQYEEFFISSTTKNVMPIRQINDIVITEQFPKTHQIQKLFKIYYRKNILKK